MSRVYVVQNQFHVVRGRRESKFNFTTAAEFGKITYLLTDQDGVSQESVHKIRVGLRDFDRREDYLIPTGHPILIGVAVSLLANVSGGVLPFLEWSGSRRRYAVRVVDLVTKKVSSPMVGE